MTFSIIGTGFILPAHIEAIRHVGGKIIDVVNTAKGENVWRDMIKTTKADCIVILTPNDLHFPMAMAAAEAGKTVLCEKPLTLKSEEAKILAEKSKNIFTVLQLRHHPLVKKLKREIKPGETYEILMDISVYRDPEYYQSWKGKTERSGGVLINLGIHYFDLLLHLFGEPEKISLSAINEKTGEGTLEGKNYRCSFKISTDAKRDEQRRVFKINGVSYNFSSKDNLSYENLHKFVYEDLLKGQGNSPQDTVPSLSLIENLYARR